jgi:3-hydroxy-3-methylglutaryl CoA synthase
MPGIAGAAAYVPRYRLPRELIAKEWGQPSAGGERAVANHDEDSLTLAMSAALNLGAEAEKADAVFFASTTAPFVEKQSAATVAAVLELPRTARTLDFTDSLRSGTSALVAALDAIQSGNSSRVLVVAGDCRMGEPDTPSEQQYGDAGAAVLITKDGGAAEIVATFSVSDEFHGSWRTREQEFPHAFAAPAFEAKFGYARVVGEAVKGVLQKAKVAPGDLATVVLPTPSPRAPQGIAKALGVDPKKQLQDGFWATIGDTGATQPLLMLAAALERAKPGDLILVAGYGDGADALVLRAQGKAVAAAAGIAKQIEVKRTLSSYGRYARFRGLVKKETTSQELSSAPILFRDRQELLPLHGGKCPKCSTVQFPRHRICIECGHTDGLDDVKLARRGTLFTFTNDFLFESPDPPVTHAVIDLDGGGRLYCQLTDCDADRVEIDMPLELTFRKIHEGGGFPNYFWKARPA